MTDTPNSLRRKIEGAGDLKSVVRTMKALAASSIAQYEEAVRSLGDYARTVDLALTASFRAAAYAETGRRPAVNRVGVIVIGTDQGLVGQFNDVLVEFAGERLKELADDKIVWAVGERIHSHLFDSGLNVAGVFDTPSSVAAITPLIGQLLIETESQQLNHESSLYLFHNQPKSGAGAVYEPVCLRLLPLDSAWRLKLALSTWPTNNLPETVGDRDVTVRALIREYLFVSLYRACAGSLAAENASRLAAMQRAEKNIDELLEELNRSFHQQRQRNIDEELFDVVSGYESMSERRG
ncbi:MAG: F0F1 ATP synthase subunit gamma [Gammaproteobacteria bacterium]